ncbi:glycerophosphodiester phosphodiesterase GDPDL7 [Tanacetum coccineum]
MVEIYFLSMWDKLIAQSPNPSSKIATTLVISHNGASIDYPGCTDLAYKKTITVGADIIEYNVQMSKDGVAFCLNPADLLGKTNAAMAFMDRSTSIPGIQPKSGVFTFDVTWTEIKSVKPLIQNPFQSGGLLRNPKAKHAGKLLTLPEILELAKKNASNVGILIGIQNAAYLASKKGLDIISAINNALKKANLDSKQQVLIQSDDTSVLAKFKSLAPSYQRVLLFTKPIADAPKLTSRNNPKTASAFMRNPCVGSNSTTPLVVMPIKPGDYLAQVEPAVLPPASTPIPPLQVTDVVDPPLPP